MPIGRSPSPSRPTPQPTLVLAIVLAVVLAVAVAVVLAVACSLSAPPQQTSSRPKAAHFAAAVERSLYFVFAFTFAFAFAVAVACSFSSKGTVISTGDAHAFVSIGAEKPASLPTPPPSQEPPLPLQLLVLRRHSERSEESPHSEGSAATRVPFSLHPNIVISTGDAHAFVSIGAEKPASPPTPPPSQEPPLPLLLLVLRRHSERSEESPHFRGERSDPSAFLPPPKHRHFDRRCSRFCEHRSGETRFSTHTASQPTPSRFCRSLSVGAQGFSPATNPCP